MQTRSQEVCPRRCLWARAAPGEWVEVAWRGGQELKGSRVQQCPSSSHVYLEPGSVIMDIGSLHI